MNAFDFDNTIYDGESVIDFFLYCMYKNKSLIKYVPHFFYNALKYKVGKLEIEKLYKSTEILSPFFAKYGQDVDKLVNSFWSESECKLKPHILKLINNEDIIISASPRFLIEKVMNKLNTKNLLCSEFNLKTGKYESLCFRENKVSVFCEKYPNDSIENFYTDSFNDTALIRFAKKSYLVKKNKNPVLIDKSKISL